MQKGRSVIGKDVLSLASGTRIHSVKDILIGEGNERVVALLVDEGGLLGTSTVVPFEAVKSIGRDAVVIDTEASVVPASSDPDVNAILTRSDHLRGKTIYTEDGRRMGSIGDVYFDEGTGRITGFEVTSGALGDLASGTSYLAVEEIRLAGREVVFIDQRGAETIEGQKGGIQGALSDVGDRLGEAAEGAREQVESGVSSLQEQGGEETPEMRLVGKRSGADVVDERGVIVIATGQRITAEQVRLARETNNLKPLYDAVDAGEARERDERMTQAARQVGDTAADLWDRFTSKLRETTDSAGQRVDEQQSRTTLAQIHDAIGRPVTKVILDRNDDVILDLGDIITHQAVQRADDAGKLDTLLASAYRAEVTFTMDQMRARVDGSSTVEKASGGAQLVDQLEEKVTAAERQRQEADEAKRKEAERSQEQKQQERAERAAARESASREQEEAEQQRREAIAVPVEEGTPSR